MRFGSFEIDATAGELLKGGTRIRLQEQPFRVLLALLERPGQTVTREELRQRLWPDDTFVDFDHALTTAVKKLRRALNDSANHPRYIETLPKRGYRFIAPLVPDGGGRDGAAAAVAGAVPIPAAPREAPRPAIRLQRNVLLAAFCVLTGILVFQLLKPGEPVVQPRVRRFSFTPESLLQGPLQPSFQRASVSPNGRHIAFISEAPDSRIWVRDLNNEQPRSLDETQGARGAYWSPDSQFIAFASGSLLKKVSVFGGPAATICPLPSSVFSGCAWSWDGSTIVLSTGLPPVLHEVPADGGVPQRLFDPVLTEAGGGNTQPTFLPLENGRRLIAFSAGGPDQRDIFIRDLDTGESLRIGPGRAPISGGNGHILYQALGPQGGLWALPFSVSRFQVLGQTFPVTASGVDPSVSDDGTLVYVDTPFSALQQLVWRDRGGQEVEKIGQPLERIRVPALSPDGRRLAAQGMIDGNYDIWVYEVDGSARTRITSDPVVDSDPVWLPSGEDLSWRFDREGNAEIYRRPIDRSQDPQPVVATPTAERPNDWCPDGTCLVYTVSSIETGSDIWVAQSTAEENTIQARPFLSTSFNEVNAKLSPDGRFLAYCSDETGSYEVYVRTFPSGSRSWQVSRNGGCEPRWGRESGELFYVHEDTLFSVPVILNPDFFAEAPRPLFSDEGLQTASPFSSTYDVSPDGSLFVLIETVQDRAFAVHSPAIRVVENWFAEFSNGAR